MGEVQTLVWLSNAYFGIMPKLGWTRSSWQPYYPQLLAVVMQLNATGHIGCSSRYCGIG